MNDEMIYHIFNYLLTYCKEYYDNSDDVKDLLNEVYFRIIFQIKMNFKAYFIDWIQQSSK